MTQPLTARPAGRVSVAKLRDFALLGLLASCTALGPLASAQPAALGIQPFAGAEVAYATTAESTQTHAVPVDRIARVDGFMQPRTSRQVTGRLSSVTWRHPRGVTSDAVFAHLREQLRDRKSVV